MLSTDTQRTNQSTIDMSATTTIATPNDTIPSHQQNDIATKRQAARRTEQQRRRQRRQHKQRALPWQQIYNR
ncbi:unnamed protein product [Rotaria sp. Silwood2]|nr:unnamed protein product [Rotaria sp. Silwood2]CAF3218538.1 unnamed protein product [Rotaria sp. Silwood2]CAF3513605.1 unnamed protein product [Rotaria sp. Silwood2]CAF4350181.1 unnamed protein product [Rotaria sp. Silwood2]CAF4603210.1 unnamed protein product [Rotaria sp. Silwood2]